MINLSSTNDKKVEKIDFDNYVMLKFSFAKKIITNPNCGEVQICSYFYKYFSDSVGKFKAFLGNFSQWLLPINVLVQFADTLSRSLQGKSHYFLISYKLYKLATFTQAIMMKKEKFSLF